MKLTRLFFFVVIISTIFVAVNAGEKVIIDSDMSFEESIKGTKAPKKVVGNLVLMDLEYYSFDDKLHKGQLLVHIDLQEDVKEIFEVIKDTKFKIHKMIPIVKYGWNDDKSMADNNSSAFCYRFIAGTKRLSNHAKGRAIDINPFNNPVIYSNGRISPKGATYKAGKAGVFDANHPVVKAFKERGWRWGGDFNSFKDYHHFDKK